MAGSLDLIGHHRTHTFALTHTHTYTCKSCLFLVKCLRDVTERWSAAAKMPDDAAVARANMHMVFCLFVIHRRRHMVTSHSDAKLTTLTVCLKVRKSDTIRNRTFIYNRMWTRPTIFVFFTSVNNIHCVYQLIGSILVFFVLRWNWFETASLQLIVEACSNKFNL